MAKQEFKPKEGEVYHASLLSNVERNTPGVTYTHDWAKVTAKEHLDQRNKAMVDAQNVKDEAADNLAKTAEAPKP